MTFDPESANTLCDIDIERSKVILVLMRTKGATCTEKMSFLNKVIGIGTGLAITGAAINATLYNGELIYSTKRSYHPMCMCLLIFTGFHFSNYYRKTF